MDLQLSGKTAIVTGGSRGIGKAIATVLAAGRHRDEALLHTRWTPILPEPLSLAQVPDHGACFPVVGTKHR